jgi:sialate O-acetylesterase
MKNSLLVTLNAGLLLAACALNPGEIGSDGDSGKASEIAREVSAIGSGSLNLGPLFGSNMVLQRDVTVPVFGTALPGATVTVDFAGQSVGAVADAAGNWLVELAPLATSAGAGMSIVSGPDQVTLTNVAVGEVWLCSGQSNMGRALNTADGSAPYIADAGNHPLRFFHMHNSDLPATTTWQLSSSSTASGFSAVCYFMGLDLSEALGVPIGLVQASFDGSAIEEWQHSGGGTGEHYDAMVVPLLPFALKGVLWYQGESNGGESSYGEKLAAMIGEWRADFALSSLPFGIVQLPATKWKAARLGQYEVAQTVSNTFLVVTHDLPGSNQLHPTAKYPVGIRSSVGARGAVYGEPIVFSGPLPAPTSTVVGSTFVIDFAHVGNGLSTSGGAPGPFQIAGADGRYQTGTATIVGGSIHVTSSRVRTPTSVRYGITGAGNLVNSIQVPIEGNGVLTSLPGSLYELELF